MLILNTPDGRFNNHFRKLNTVFKCSAMAALFTYIITAKSYQQLVIQKNHCKPIK